MIRVVEFSPLKCTYGIIVPQVGIFLLGDYSSINIFLKFVFKIKPLIIILIVKNFILKSQGISIKIFFFKLYFFIQFCSHSFQPINRFEFWRNILKITESQKIFSISNNLSKNEQTHVHQLISGKHKSWPPMLFIFWRWDEIENIF